MLKSLPIPHPATAATPMGGTIGELLAIKSQAIDGVLGLRTEEGEQDDENGRDNAHGCGL